ncbi:membrane-anchored junction protein-like [Sarcoramphus papa]
MRFKHGKVHLVPYPYICTVYLELNSFQQNVSCGEEVNKGSDELVSCACVFVLCFGGFLKLHSKLPGGAEYLYRQC